MRNDVKSVQIHIVHRYIYSVCFICLPFADWSHRGNTVKKSTRENNHQTVFAENVFMKNKERHLQLQHSVCQVAEEWSTWGSHRWEKAKEDQNENVKELSLINNFSQTCTCLPGLRWFQLLPQANWGRSTCTKAKWSVSCGIIKTEPLKGDMGQNDLLVLHYRRQSLGAEGGADQLRKGEFLPKWGWKHNGHQTSNSSSRGVSALHRFFSE